MPVSAAEVGIVVASRTTPAEPAWCHQHEVHECAAVLVAFDGQSYQAVGVCHTAPLPGRPWCGAHTPTAEAGR